MLGNQEGRGQWSGPQGFNNVFLSVGLTTLETCNEF